MALDHDADQRQQFFCGVVTSRPLNVLAESAPVSCASLIDASRYQPHAKASRERTGCAMCRERRGDAIRAQVVGGSDGRKRGCYVALVMS